MFISELEKQERKETFIQKSIIKFGDKFDYSMVNYINSTTKVKIICNEHGDFLKTPRKHLVHKYSCPKCAKVGYSKSTQINKEEFLKQATLMHGNKYSYDEVTIKTRKDKIKIYCKEHQSYFEQQLNVHLDGRTGCKKCLSKIKKEYAHETFKQNFINEFTKKFGTEYDFAKVKYINNKTPILIKCNKHDIEFFQVPRNIHRAKTCSCSECKSEFNNK